MMCRINRWATPPCHLLCIAALYIMIYKRLFFYAFSFFFCSTHHLHAFLPSVAIVAKGIDGVPNHGRRRQGTVWSELQRSLGGEVAYKGQDVDRVLV